MKHTYVEVTDIGNRVICDVCNEDWTGRPESGGFLFGSYGYCPECAKKNITMIKAYGEDRYIRAWCPPNQSFAEWCLSLRNGGNTIRVISTKEEP